MPRFLPPEQATDDGLLAIGGDLSPDLLIEAYRQGIFPWYMPGQPVLWWSPDPRMVLHTDSIRISRSLRKRLRNSGFHLTFDRDFEAVVRACRDLRGARDSWIDEAMIRAYTGLHVRGYAHSVEVWSGGELAGGLYGVSIGRAFFGESMFHRERDASKVALVVLARHLRSWGYPMIDCQVSSDHLASLGATEMSRADFLARIRRLVDETGRPPPWEIDPARMEEEDGPR